MADKTFPYHVGYGLCKEDFTIEDVPVADFMKGKDAEMFIKARTYDPLSFDDERIYYIDRPVQDGQKMIPVRYIFNRNTNEFVEGTEAKGIKIPGYDVYATYYDDMEEEYYTEHTICISYQQAERVRERYLKEIGNGVVDIEIEEDVDIDVMKDFWGAEKFFSGDFQNKIALEEKINELRNTPYEGGETVAQRIGTALEDVSSEDMMRYFEKHVSGGPDLIRNYMEDQIIKDEISRMQTANWREMEVKQEMKEMSREEKEAFIGGIDLSADYGFEVSEDDMQLYHAILNEQKYTARAEIELER